MRHQKFTLIFIIFVLIHLIPISGLAKERVAQADRLIQQVLNNRDVTFSYFAILELTETYPDVELYVAGEFENLNTIINSAVACAVHSYSTSSELPEVRFRNRLLQFYRCSGNADYLVVWLYQFPQEERQRRILDEVPDLTEVYRDDIAFAYLQKSLGDNYDELVLTQTREFRLVDLYMFSGGFSVSDTETNGWLDLVNYWANSLGTEPKQVTIRELYLSSLIAEKNHIIIDSQGVFRYLNLFKTHNFFPDSRRKLTLFKRIAYSSYILGYYQTMLSFYRDDLLPLSQNLSNYSQNIFLEEFLKVRIDYGTNHFRLGNIVAAKTIYESVYPYINDISDIRSRSVLLNNLAVCYLNTGESDKYLQLQLSALNNARASGESTVQLQILKNLYVYHSRLNNWESAFEFLTQASELARKTNNLIELANIYSLTGFYYRERLNDYDLALNYYHQAREIFIKSGGYQDLLYVNSELANSYTRTGDYETAINLLNEISTSAQSRNNRSVYLGALIALGDVYLNTNNMDKALEVINEIERFELANIEFDEQIRIYNLISKYRIKTNNKSYALDLLREHIPTLLNTLRTSADYQSGAIRFKPEYLTLFSNLVFLYFDAGMETEAILLMDDIKNLNRAGFYNSSLLKSTVLSEDELLRDVTLTNRIQRLRNELLVADADDRRNINRELMEAQAEQAVILGKFRRYQSDESLNIRRLQKSMSADEQIISYSFFDNYMYVTRIEKRNFALYQVFLDDEDRILLAGVGSNISNENVNLTALYKVYKRILDGYLNHSLSGTITIIPDGLIYNLPFEVLPVTEPEHKQAYGSARYVIENNPVSYLPSLSDRMIEKPDRKTPEFDFLGIGISRHSNNTHSGRNLSPLPYAVKEVQSVSSALSLLTKKETLINEHGTEQSFRELARTSSIIHIATHSEVNSTDPLFSVIYLNNENDDNERYDGMVYAYELFDLDINSKLVMLSSCESGSGTYIIGSGMIGLGRALTYAGAASLVMNLWNIRDQTASELSVAFYDLLNQGYSKDKALQLAKLAYLNTTNSNPYYWGSFVLIGETEPLLTDSRLLMSLFLGLFVLISIGTALFLYYKNSHWYLSNRY